MYIETRTWKLCHTLPDLEPCDFFFVWFVLFFLFPDLQKCLVGRRFSSRSSLRPAVFQCVSHNYTQDRDQTDISAVGRKTWKVCCSRWESTLKSCRRRKSFAMRRTHFTSLFETKMKHPCKR